MKNLKKSATITGVLGIFAILSLIGLFMALSDIAKQTEDLKLEWFVAGICMIILSAFTISTFVTLALLIKNLFSKRGQQ